MDEDARLGSGAVWKDFLARRHAARLTSALGIAFAVLFLAGPALLAWTPSVHATDADLATFYASDDRR